MRLVGGDRPCLRLETICSRNFWDFLGDFPNVRSRHRPRGCALRPAESGFKSGGCISTHYRNGRPVLNPAARPELHFALRLDAVLNRKRCIAHQQASRFEPDPSQHRARPTEPREASEKSTAVVAPRSLECTAAPLESREQLAFPELVGLASASGGSLAGSGWLRRAQAGSGGSSLASSSYAAAAIVVTHAPTTIHPPHLDCVTPHDCWHSASLAQHTPKTKRTNIAAATSGLASSARTV